MKKRTRFLLPALFSAGMVSLFLSCSSAPDIYGEMDAGVVSGSYKAALSSLDNERSAARKKIYTPKNEVLLHLDRGMIAHYAGRYEDSSRDLETAERLIEAAFTKSISQEIGTYLLNDNSRDYAGEDYEDLYINVFNSLNYYHSGDLEGALVEIRRLNEKLQFLADRYERSVEKVRQSGNLGLASAEASHFSNSALARYLGVLFFRGTGRNDDARIDYEEFKRAYELSPEVYTRPVPSSLEDELSIPPELGRLNVLAFAGLSPIKEEENIIIPLPFDFPNNSARIALPRLVNRFQTIERAEAVLEDGRTIALELVEDLGAVARETFKSSYGLTVLKTTARTIAKAGTGAALSWAVEEDEEDDDSLAGFLVGLLGRAFTEVSEQADTRLSRYFPRYALAGGINVEPGIYEVTVNFYGRGRLIHSQKKEIAVKQNSLNLEEFVCLK